MHLLPDHPADTATILHASIKLYAACFSKLRGLLLILASFFSALGFIGYPLLTDLYEIYFSNEDVTRIGLYLGACVFVASLPTFALLAAMVYRIDNLVKQRQDSFSSALKVGLVKFPGLLIGSVGYSLAVMVGFVLFLIPGLILSLSLSFYFYSIIFDGKGGYSSLQASHDLVRGNWRRTLNVFTLPGMAFMVLEFGALPLIYVVILNATSNPILISLANISANLLTALITAYFFTLGYVQFQDLILRKGSTD